MASAHANNRSRSRTLSATCSPREIDDSIALTERRLALEAIAPGHDRTSAGSLGCGNTRLAVSSEKTGRFFRLTHVDVRVDPDVTDPR
jgi:hypothetical protein